jgi:tetratricopeptide (TPR) repeat protein
MTSRVRLALAVCFALIQSAAAQSGRVSVVDVTGKEARHTAHRLRISIQQLHNARAALEEATELARRSDAPVDRVGGLGWLWSQYHRGAAVAKIELVLVSVRTRAQEAVEPTDYTKATAAAQQLLAPLAELDPDRALELVQGWPLGPGEVAAAEQARRDLEASFRRDRGRQIAYRDPEQALAVVDQGSRAEGARYPALARLAADRYRAGRKDEALRLADQALADFERRQPGAGTYAETMFIQDLAQVDPDRALAAFESLARVDPTRASGPQMALRAGGRTVVLTPAESTQLNALQMLHNRPELRMRALGNIPSLKAKLDEAGGIDQVLNPDPSTGIEPIYLMNQVSSDGSIPAPPAGGKLWAELRPKALRDPGGFEQVLSEKRLDANALLDLAQRASNEAPEIASLALRQAGDALPRVQPLEKRLSTLRMLVVIARRIEGEVDPALWTEAFRWTAEYREEERAKFDERAVTAAPPPAMMGMTRAEMFEATLLGDYARADFEAAMSRTRRLPTPARLSALTTIAQSMRQF